VLGPLVVEATRAQSTPARVRPLIAVEPSLDASVHDVMLHAVVPRDLELSGEFRLLPSPSMPSGAVTSERAPDLDVWRGTGSEALVRLRATTLKGGETVIAGSVFLLQQDDNPVFTASFVRRNPTRLTAHLLTDALIGVLTGRPGSFASHLTFTQSRGGARRAFTIDADGHGLRVASGEYELVSASAFDPRDRLLFAASVRHGRYELHPSPARTPFPNGSIYGIAFDPSRSKVALALAVGKGVGIFEGPSDFSTLRRVSRNELALHPSYSASGQLAYVGVDGNRSRIYVGTRPVSPLGLRVGTPTFCDHPNGLRLVYAADVGRRTHLIVADESGRTRRWLTRGRGDQTDPACSPDGRLVAFFSSGYGRDGRPGLYLMPVEGGEPRRISSAMGDTLRWASILGAEPPAVRVD